MVYGRSFEQWFSIYPDVIDIVPVVVESVLVLTFGPQKMYEHEDSGKYEHGKRHDLQAVSADCGVVVGHGHSNLLHQGRAITVDRVQRQDLLRQVGGAETF